MRKDRGDTDIRLLFATNLMLFQSTLTEGCAVRDAGMGGGGFIIDSRIKSSNSSPLPVLDIYCSTNLRIPIPHIAAFTSNID